MTARRRLGVDMPTRGIQFVAHRQGSSAVEQPRKLSGLVDGETLGEEKISIKCQGSSAVEQGTHKPLVGSSILPSGTFRYGLGLHSSGRNRAPLHWFDVSTSTPVLRSTCEGTPRLRSDSAEH